MGLHRSRAVPNISRLVRRRTQRQEEEEVQAKVQRQEEEEPQAKFQRQEEEEPQAKLQRQEEEEEAQAKLQRQEEEEPQAKLQRQEEEEEELQTKLQRQEEEEPQAKLQLQEEEEEAQAKLQRQEEEEPQAKLQLQEEEEEVQTRLQRQEEEEPQAKLQLQEEEEQVQARVQRQEEEEVQAKAESQVHSGGHSGGLESSLSSSRAEGRPLPEDTRTQMESGFGADFNQVRVHTDERAVSLSQNLNAQAFTHGSDIYFNEGKYDPGSSAGSHLLAHELTHTVQQGASPTQAGGISSRGTKAVQGSWLGDAWGAVSGAVSDAAEWVGDSLSAGIDYVKDQALDFIQAIPGYSLFTVVIGEDPISGDSVERNGRNFIEAGLDIIPNGQSLKQKLEEEGALAEAAQWLDGQIALLDISPSTIASSLRRFWDGLSLSDIGDVRGVLNRLANIFQGPIQRIISFAGNVATKLLQIIKDYVISTLVTFIRDNTRGYPLLTVILGRDPISKESVDRTPIALLRGFMELSETGAEQLRQMEESGSLQKAADWLDGAIERLNLSFELIGNTFQSAWDLLTIESLLAPMDTFWQLYELFVEPVGRIINFLIEVAAKVLGFIKDALISRLVAYARTIRGYPLLTVILGQDPFSEEPVKRNAENIIRGFMSLMDGGEEQFQQMKESGAIARMTARIEGAIAALNFTWEFIRGLFMTAWESFLLEDLAAPFETFSRIMGIFAEPLMRLIAFLATVIRMVIEVALQLMNFPVNLISNIITKAMQAINDIQRDPVGFLKNLLRAVKTGFMNFLGNFATHLINGLVGWLFGELEEAGITAPPDLSFRSILGLVLDVLGISIDRIFEKLAERIGPERVAQIRGMLDRLSGIWAFVSDVITRGPIAIWEYIQEKLNNLWDIVLDAVRNWVMIRIIEQVTVKLLSMLDPTGIMAVVNSFIAFYKAVQSFIRYLTEMLEVVNSFVEGVAEIARGSVENAAQFLENALARAMPVAIGFLANQVGLGGLGQKIGEMIETVRGLVDQALDWLIDKAVSAGTAFLNMVQSGVETVKGGIANLKEWWSSSEPVTTQDGEDHEIGFSGSGSSASLEIRSSPGTEYIKYLTGIKTKHSLTDAQIKPAKDKAAEIETEKNRNVPDDQKEAQGQTIHGLVSQLAQVTRALPLGTPGKSAPPVYGPEMNNYGSSVTVSRLLDSHLPGSDADRAPPNTDWTILKQRKQGGDTLFVRGHLLNKNLGGPANWSNLTPLTQAANNKDSTSHYHAFEKHVVEAVHEVVPKKQVNFLVTAIYGRPFNSTLYDYFFNQGNPDDDDRAQIVKAEQHVPNFLKCESYELKPDGTSGNLVKKHTVDNSFTQKDDEYPLAALSVPKVPVYLNEMKKQELLDINGIGPTLADLIINNRNFRTKAEVLEKAKIGEGRWAQMQTTPGKLVRIYRS